MRRRKSTARQPRYRAVASWRQKIDVEALARALLMLALHRAGQNAAATGSRQTSTTATPSARDASAPQQPVTARVDRANGGQS